MGAKNLRGSNFCFTSNVRCHDILDSDIHGPGRRSRMWFPLVASSCHHWHPLVVSSCHHHLPICNSQSYKHEKQKFHNQPQIFELIDVTNFQIITFLIRWIEVTNWLMDCCLPQGCLYRPRWGLVISHNLLLHARLLPRWVRLAQAVAILRNQKGLVPAYSEKKKLRKIDIYKQHWVTK